MHSLNGVVIAIVGGGNMAEAIVSGLLAGKLTTADHIVVSGPREARGQELHERYGVRTTTSNVEAVAGVAIVVLAVKPQFMATVLAELKGKIADTALIISIAAGVTLATIHAALEHANIVRSMPNTPGRIGKGITVWTAMEVDDAHRAQTTQILGALGAVEFVAEEKYLDAVTAVSGTGPAYVFFLMEAMIAAAVREGLPRHLALKLVLQTFAGSVAYAREAGVHLAQLRDDVTSPAGTTAEALYALEDGGVRVALYNAVRSAHERSRQLGGGNGANGSKK
jgi:pyrroline-5-carboxylate reductase